jgi:hypothetical protein
MFNTPVRVSNTQPRNCVLMAQEGLVNVIHVRVNLTPPLHPTAQQAAWQAAGVGAIEIR